MAGTQNRKKASSRGLLCNYRLLCKKAMIFRGMECASKKRKRQAKRKRNDDGLVDELLQESKRCRDGQNFKDKDSTQTEAWEVDSGFSEGSPPASGRSSPCPSSSAAAAAPVVALDCEMVGSGPHGRNSELARCSILDYHGNVIYDKYIRPLRPVTDYRTRWSGIRPHHLRDAMPYPQAREEIVGILKGKVVVGHSIHNDFGALGVLHPAHMVRDTGATCLLARLAGFSRRRCVSLKILARKLLDRRIQVGKTGHCSVEDALAALDLYKMVEGEWEWELQSQLMQDNGYSAQFMRDEYWPAGADEEDGESEANTF